MKRFIARYDRQKSYIMSTIVGPIIVISVLLAATLLALLVLLFIRMNAWIMPVTILFGLEAVAFTILVFIFKKTWRKRNKLYHKAIETTSLWAMIVLVLFDIVIGGRPQYLD
ncbi:MAG: hypothetical protein WCQ49_00730 [Candidatus Saccharibacteria bacterium]